MNAHPKRLTLIGVLILTAGAAVWAVLSLRDDDSTLVRVFVSYASKRMGWSADSTSWDVLRRMAKYEEQSRYDEAIKAGDAWTEKHPKSDSMMFPLLAGLCLRRAKAEGGHADEYVTQAMLYRDKALPFVSDDISGLRDLALLSEAGGDISATQRCVQYRNAIKLLEHLADVLRERRAVAPKQEAFVAPRQGTSAQYVLTVEDIDTILERTNGTVTRVREKLQKSSCD